MNNSTLAPITAVATGILIGTCLTLIGQKLLNDYHKKVCPPMSTHQLVVVSGMAGDAYYCVDKRYI